MKKLIDRRWTNWFSCAYAAQSRPPDPEVELGDLIEQVTEAYAKRDKLRYLPKVHLRLHSGQWMARIHSIVAVRDRMSDPVDSVHARKMSSEWGRIVDFISELNRLNRS